MSNIGLGFGTDDEGEPTGAPDEESAPGTGRLPLHPAPPAPPAPPLPRAGSRRAAPAGGGRFRSCLPLLVALVVIIVATWFGGSWAIDKIKSLTGDNPDYSSTTGTTTTVTVEVHSGDTAAAIGRTLKAADVVKSVGAFVDAASANNRSIGIRFGFYRMPTQLKASAAVTYLIEHKPISAPSCERAQRPCTITIPEGFRLTQIRARLLAQGGFKKSEVTAAFNHPAALGLPPEANGKLEGYLFPATYTVVPGASATSVLEQMVDQTKTVEKELNIAAKARALGYSVNDIMTIASILQFEAKRAQDIPKVARAIYNRLKIGMALQSDATVAFANNLTGTIYTTAEQRAIDSPYNTYKNTGLPPGPIGAPSERDIKAALNPTPGPWLYWVVVNLRTGETRFNTTLAGHNADVQAFHEYCQTSDAC